MMDENKGECGCRMFREREKAINLKKRKKKKIRY